MAVDRVRLKKNYDSLEMMPRRSGQPNPLIIALLIGIAIAGASAYQLFAQTVPPSGGMGTAFDSTWHISQRAYGGTTLGTGVSNGVLNLRLNNVTSIPVNYYGPYSYALGQKGLMDWGPATTDFINASTVTFTFRVNNVQNVGSPYDVGVYVGFYYQLKLTPTPSGCTPSYQGFLDVQYSVFRTRGTQSDTSLCTGSYHAYRQAYNVTIGQTYTYTITALEHFQWGCNNVATRGGPNVCTIGYKQYGLEFGIEGYNKSLSTDYLSFSLK